MPNVSEEAPDARAYGYASVLPGLLHHRQLPLRRERLEGDAVNPAYIMAIDPGTKQSAYVLWDANNKTVLDKGIFDNDRLIETIKSNTLTDSVVIEMVASYGMPVGKEVFETCVWIGRFYQAARCPVHLLYRREVKMYLCGNMRAKDGNIRQALIDMLGKDVCKGVSKDVWSALAVAVTYVGSVVGIDEPCKIAKDCGL